MTTRTEKDTFGPLEVPADRLVELEVKHLEVQLADSVMGLILNTLFFFRNQTFAWLSPNPSLIFSIFLQFLPHV